MQKKAGEIKTGDKIIVGGEALTVSSIELSEVGKQGSKKCRIETKKANGETFILIRPADYPLNVI